MASPLADPQFPDGRPRDAERDAPAVPPPDAHALPAPDRPRDAERDAPAVDHTDDLVTTPADRPCDAERDAPAIDHTDDPVTTPADRPRDAERDAPRWPDNPPPYENFDLPVIETWCGDPVPDLNRIPESGWGAALLRVPRDARDRAISRLVDRSRVITALDIAWRLPTVRAAAVPSPLAHPGDVPRPRRLRGQVNMRLGVDDRTRLDQAAKLLGLLPTQLARTLVTNGVRRILIDHGIDP